MKKSVTLFIVWAAVAVVLTFLYLGLMRYAMAGNYDTAKLWQNIVFMLTFAYSAVMLPLVRKRAKNEGVTWLAVVSKVALIVYSSLAAAAVLIFALGLLIG